jgi:crossover junction endodeoxyribonuclease RuvC
MLRSRRRWGGSFIGSRKRMKPDFVLGIDPGLGGALCLLEISSRKIAGIFDMPVADGRVDPAKLAGIVEMCKAQSSIAAAVELVGSMPRQAGAFDFGVSAGVVHGVLGAMGVPFTLVQPAQWKGATGLRKAIGETQAQNKTRARALAMELWPEKADLFKRVKDDGRAEACLIARYSANRMGDLE